MYRAIDQHGQVIDVLAPNAAIAQAARAFFARAAWAFVPSPVEVTTDRAPAYPRVIDELIRPRDTSASCTRTTLWNLITAG